LPSCFLNDKQSPCALRESIVNGGARWLALRNCGVHIAITDWDLSATEVQAATADKDRQDFGMNRSLLGDNICRFREFRTAASTAAIVRKTQLRKSSNNSGRICNRAISRRRSRTLRRFSRTSRIKQRNSDSSRSGSNAASQLFEQVGQELQSGNLSFAQQTFSSLRQELSQPTTSTSSTSSLSITA